MPLPRPCLCLVTDRRAVAPDARTPHDEIRELEAQLDGAMGAGIDVIQVRERDLDAATQRALTARLVGRAPVGTRVVVNDRADVARAAGAAGVHLRADGPAPARVRALGPPAWLVGASAHTAGEVDRAAGADYLIFGTVFASTSKGAATPVSGVAALEAAVARATAPVLAIGGITPARVAACREAGAAGLAAIGVFLPPGRAAGALGAARAVRALRQAWAGDL